MATITSFSGNVPKHYETYLGPLFFEPYAVDLVERIEVSEPLNNVLEIACGTGRVTKHLATTLPSAANLVATDLNNDMLAIAKQVVTDRELTWQVADAHDLPFGDCSFDLVVCQYGVMFFGDKPKAFAEINRILRPGGVFLFNTWHQLQYNALSQMAQTVLEQVHPTDPPKFLEKGPYSFYDQSAIQQLVEEAGFSIGTIELVAKTGIASTADDAINGILEGTPNYVYMMERNISVPLVKDRLKASLVKHYGETDLQLPMQAFVVKAIRQ